MIPFIGRFYVVEGYIRNTSTFHPTTLEVTLVGERDRGIDLDQSFLIELVHGLLLDEIFIFRCYGICSSSKKHFHFSIPNIQLICFKFFCNG